MPTTFSAAGGEVTAVVNKVMGQHHQKLADAGVRIGVVMAANKEDAAVKNGGYPAAAKIKVVSLKDRVSKSYDAEIVLDEHEWEEAKPARRAALIDHELSHLTVIYKSGGVARDVLGRPKLRAVLGDWNGGDGFTDVVVRHGVFAYEHSNSVTVRAKVDGAMKKHKTLFDNVAEAGG